MSELLSGSFHVVGALKVGGKKESRSGTGHGIRQVSIGGLRASLSANPFNETICETLKDKWVSVIGELSVYDGPSGSFPNFWIVSIKEFDQ